MYAIIDPFSDFLLGTVIGSMAYAAIFPANVSRLIVYLQLR